MLVISCMQQQDSRPKHMILPRRTPQPLRTADSEPARESNLSLQCSGLMIGVYIDWRQRYLHFFDSSTLVLIKQPEGIVPSAIQQNILLADPETHPSSSLHWSSSLHRLPTRESQDQQSSEAFECLFQVSGLPLLTQSLPILGGCISWLSHRY